jgi:hypothetical protein
LSHCLFVYRVICVFSFVHALLDAALLSTNKEDIQRAKAHPRAFLIKVRQPTRVHICLV